MMIFPCIAFSLFIFVGFGNFLWGENLGYKIGGFLMLCFGLFMIFLALKTIIKSGWGPCSSCGFHHDNRETCKQAKARIMG